MQGRVVLGAKEPVPKADGTRVLDLFGGLKLVCGGFASGILRGVCGRFRALTLHLMVLCESDKLIAGGK